MPERINYGGKLEKELRTRVAFGETPDGKYDLEPFRATQQINDKFNTDPLYIGATPFGSTQLGYANSSSDIDVAVFGDSSRAQFHADMQKFEKNVHNFAQKLNFSKRTKILLVVIYPDTIERVMRLSLARSWNPMVMGMWHLLFHPMAIGPGIDRFRTLAADEIKKMTKDQQKSAVTSLARTAVFYESLGIGKINERISGIDDAYNLLEAYPTSLGRRTTEGEPEGKSRIAVWENQIRQSAGLQE